MGNKFNKQIETQFFSNLNEYLKQDRYNLTLNNSENTKPAKEFTKSKFSVNTSNINILDLSMNLICHMNMNKKIQNKNVNLYFSQLFPNINESNNTKEEKSILERSILNKDDWFKKICNRLNRFLRLESDHYEKPRFLNSSYVSKDILNFNQSLEMTKFSTNDILKTIGHLEENGMDAVSNYKYKNRHSVLSVGEKMNKSVRNINSNPLNKIHEIEYSDDINIQIANQKIKPSKLKMSKYFYSEMIRNKLFSNNYNIKRKAKSTNKIKIELKDKNRTLRKNTQKQLRITTKSQIKHLNNNLISPRLNSPILNKNYIINGEDIYNTNLFLEDIEMLININNHVSMETYTSAMKFKTEKKKSFITVKSKLTTSTKKSYANVILDNYKKSSLKLESYDIPKIMNYHNSVFSLKDEVMNIPKFEKADIIKSIQNAQIAVLPENDKSSFNNTRRNNFDRKSSSNSVARLGKTYEEGESGLNMQGLKALLRKKRLIENDKKCFSKDSITK